VQIIIPFSPFKVVKHDIQIFHLKPNLAGYHCGGDVGQGFSYKGMKSYQDSY